MIDLELIDRAMDLCKDTWSIKSGALVTGRGNAFPLEELKGNELFAVKKILAAYGLFLWRWLKVEAGRQALLDLSLFTESPDIQFEAYGVLFSIGENGGKGEILCETGKEIAVGGEVFSVYAVDSGFPLESVTITPRFSGEAVVNMEAFLQKTGSKIYAFLQEGASERSWWRG